MHFNAKVILDVSHIYQKGSILPCTSDIILNVYFSLKKQHTNHLLHVNYTANKTKKTVNSKKL